ncbi:type II toxin-antitoxin system RelE/ParE family toxin [Hydrogenophilus thermoluteolus]|uniref:type II toxin-antitoxin system RelE/ParE family toxin n=1 Tax=Hydrogenophilus thermoluteolus TaxID=297 RepID=UPI003F68136F
MLGRQELEEAFAFYEQEQPGLGRRFLDEVQACRDLIKRLPEAWHPLGNGLRRCRLRHFRWGIGSVCAGIFPYGLIYRAQGVAPGIIAVAHLHRAPEYWCDRARSKSSHAP